MDSKKISEILGDHLKWLINEEAGKRANLSGADLSGADLSGANLQRADLSGANLQRADLREANLWRADLRRADLSGADLSGADLQRAVLRVANLRGAELWGADLMEANLWGADLMEADLRRADLRRADLREANLWRANLRGARNVPESLAAMLLTCPEEGSFIGWKKCANDELTVIIKLLITEDAKRSSATTRKCRCSKAKVLDIQDIEGNSILKEYYHKAYGCITRYAVGEMVYPDSFDEDRWNECSNGIHFFITRQEAIDY